MTPMNDAIIVAIGLAAVIADAIRDKRHYGKSYPRWHRQFRRFRPVFIWRKVQNRWHIAKQLGFLAPHAVIAYGLPIEYTAIYIIGGALAWRCVKVPKWWDD